MLNYPGNLLGNHRCWIVDCVFVFNTFEVQVRLRGCRLPVIRGDVRQNNSINNIDATKQFGSFMLRRRLVYQDLYLQKHPTLSRLLERHIDQQRAVNTLDGHNEKGRKFHELNPILNRLCRSRKD